MWVRGACRSQRCALKTDVTESESGVSEAERHNAKMVDVAMASWVSKNLHIRLVSTYRKKGHPITKSTYMYLELTHLLSPSLFCWKSKHEAPLAPAFQPNICYRMGRRLCFPRLGNLMHCHGLQISHLGCNIRVYGACLSTWRPHISLEPRENHSYWRYTGYMDPREALTNGPSSDHGQP